MSYIYLSLILLIPLTTAHQDLICIDCERVFDCEIAKTGYTCETTKMRSRFHWTKKPKFYLDLGECIPHELDIQCLQGTVLSDTHGKLLSFLLKF